MAEQLSEDMRIVAEAFKAARRTALEYGATTAALNDAIERIAARVFPDSVPRRDLFLSCADYRGRTTGTKRHALLPGGEF